MPATWETCSRTPSLVHGGSSGSCDAREHPRNPRSSSAEHGDHQQWRQRHAHTEPAVRRLLCSSRTGERDRVGVCFVRDANGHAMVVTGSKGGPLRERKVPQGEDAAASMQGNLKMLSCAFPAMRPGPVEAKTASQRQRRCRGQCRETSRCSLALCSCRALGALRADPRLLRKRRGGTCAPIARDAAPDQSSPRSAAWEVYGGGGSHGTERRADRYSDARTAKAALARYPRPTHRRHRH
jgi:hypothetical protein